MKLQAYRIVKAKLADEAFTGEGARRFGGRWNGPGVAMVYLSSSISLAMLEILVHLTAQELLPRYVMFPVTFDDTLVMDLDRAALPADWRTAPAPAELPAIGDQWIASNASPLLRVPSAIVPEEDNYLLNPAHPHWRQIEIGRKQAIRFDPRLK